jgi:cytochrome c-type biogenesis protein
MKRIQIPVRMTVLLHTLCFIFGFSIIFILLSAIAGIASGQLLTLLREGLDWVAKIGGILTLLFGVHMTSLFSFLALLGEKRGQIHKKPRLLPSTRTLELCPVFCLTAQP